MAEETSASDANIFVYLDISFSDVKAGRIIIELFKNEAPKTVENFRALCTGEKGIGKNNKPLHYKGSKFHRVIPQCFAQGGDITQNDGNGGESIYQDGFFEVENNKRVHDQEGLVGMATVPNTNIVNSQFYITVVPCEQLDGTNIVFGRVRKGLDIVKEMSTIPANCDCPLEDIVIEECGELKSGQPWNIHVLDGTNDVYPPWPNDWEEGTDSQSIEKAIDIIRESGNFFFSRKKYPDSQMKYIKVLRYIDWYLKSGKEPNKSFIESNKFRTLLNLAAVKLKRKSYKDALNYCNECECIDPTNGKVYYRRAQARLGLRDIDESLQDLRKAMSLMPKNKSIEDFYKVAKADKLNHLKKERDFFKKVFK
ncbi:peptidyl-prolyl cis-trans isomerase D isoform X3 [Harmonia axyridis]|uniref:peptidyl-prolyl cis-trans isomerase D isoform X3 n=1 Tax=Harmonia axyridis TaxID=115357 RepID=UPI001E2759D3|nr:peptidyl-prolyl cis-trans isomerase D isoform X3 [Harmonia axyridis]